VQHLLPHRYPFLLVDRVDVVEPGRHVRGLKQLTIGEWWSSGGLTVIPHMLLLEALAQTSGSLIADLAEGAPGAIAYFMGAERVRMRGAARVGDEVTLDVYLRQWRRGICRTHGIASSGDGEVLRAELLTIVRA
jgi:3-hydroxymyristoyl/3-hydroxydecanoyl-(acyl carrier protein) dehydratase